MKYNNGDIYKGNFKLNKKNGKGILCFNQEEYLKIIQNIYFFDKNNKILFNLNLKNSIYIGEFINDKKEGKGILFMNNDELVNENIIYEGEFKNNKMIGIVYFYFKNGNYIKGHQKDDLFDNSQENILYLKYINIFYKKQYNIII